jgi:hypothetical protein
VVEDEQFVFYDDGEDPKKKSLVRNPRQEIGAMIFEKGKRTIKKPRQKTVLLADPDAGNILHRYEHGDLEGITEYISNPP